ncbi:NACHT domain-containing protein [Streptomyces sp. N50]|uniref:NACHT domain-containing protein n=1 Tax=Streptomyces sp. N50 TaxID=3081765 RepID=UPI0029622FE2|nr:NACHT domain-containing protein [Streptomyces sp. N50]WOX10287.1 NACHT domain-containing protein [Streptomyces sp. N50]
MDAERIVAVRCAQKRGSGFLITPRLILTAAHVIQVSEREDGEPAQITALASIDAGVVKCDVVWQPTDDDRFLDAALLLARSDAVLPETAQQFTPITWGEFHNLEPRSGCFATGFPVVGRRESMRPRAEQIWGTLAPGAGIGTGRYVLSTEAFPPAANKNEKSPWAGLSGAAVFFRKSLIGLVVEDDSPSTWRHSRVNVLPVAKLLEDTSFHEVLTTIIGRNVFISGVSDEEIIDQAFEDRYAQSVRAEHGKIRLFGLDLSRSTSRGLDLDTAYLNLEAVSSDDSHQELFAETRVDALLKGKQRILLRGQAGSGKSTLIQWIATKSVAGALEGSLSSLNGRIPFVLRLRAMFRLDKLRPNPSEFLHIGSIPIADDQPIGWADRVMRDGRALLLVDGMDEIPDENRHEAREWLGWILEHYPTAWALVTVRPSAVPRNWLADYGFRELMLSPMDRADRQIFIDQWHKAALVEVSPAAASVMELERVARELSDLQKGLLRSLEVSPQLAVLTDSPLLCAMICALHRDRNGALPSGRMEIYRAALGMLIARRDQERLVDLQLEEDEHRSLLQEIAAWLVNEGLVEGGRTDAINQISRILPSLHRVHLNFTPEEAYDHVVDRSGLITETSTETFEFIHRTFQDYLAAQEFKEARSFSMLARHANDEQWDDVIRMTVGHCDHRDRADLLKRLVEAGDATEDRVLRRRIHLLAGSCLPYASRLDGQVREMVLARISAQLPESAVNTHEAEKLATVGDDIISLIPLTGVKPWALEVLSRLRSDRAFDFLREISGNLDDICLQYLGGIWDSFDTERFSTEVLTRVNCKKVRFWVDDPLQLKELSKLGQLGDVALDCLRQSNILSILKESPLQASRFSVVNASRLDNVDFIRSISGIESLSLLGCRPLSNLSAISELNLKSLTVVDASRFRQIDPPVDISGVLEGQGDLVELGLGHGELRSLQPALSLQRVSNLTIWNPGRGIKDLYRAAELFPNVEVLELRLNHSEKRQVIDVSPFADRKRFHLIVKCQVSPVIRGRKKFADNCLRVDVIL